MKGKGWTAQCALHSTPGRPVHSDTNSTSLGSILPCCNLQREDYSHIFPPLYIARYWFIQSSDFMHHNIKIEDIWRECSIEPMTTFRRQKWMQWYGHVLRKEGEDTTKKMITMQVQGKRRRGCPRKDGEITSEKTWRNTKYDWRDGRKSKSEAYEDKG